MLQAGVVSLGFIKFFGEQSFLGGWADKYDSKGNNELAKVLRRVDSTWFVAKRGIHWALVPLMDKLIWRQEAGSDAEAIIMGVGIMTFALPIAMRMLTVNKRGKEE